MTIIVNRTIKELLELMLDNQDRFISGLCFWANMLPNLTWMEHRILKKYIDNNRPSMFSSTNAFLHTFDAYYWKEGDIEPRIKWIKKHIEKLNK